MALTVSNELSKGLLVKNDLQMALRAANTIRDRLLNGVKESRDGRGNVMAPGISAEEYRSLIGVENEKVLAAAGDLLLGPVPAAKPAEVPAPAPAAASPAPAAQ